MRLEILIKTALISTFEQSFDPSKFSPQINYADNEALNTNKPIQKVSAFQVSQSYENPVSRLDGQYKVLPDQGFPGFISKALCDVDGNFDAENAPYVTLISSGAPLGIAVAFSEGYPVKYSITAGGVTKYYDNNTSKIINVVDDTNTQFKLTIHKWHIDANDIRVASVKIVSIIPIFDMTYTESDLISVTNSETLFDSQMNIAPGICEQYADIRIYDRNNLLHQLAYIDKLNDDYTVTIYAIDTEKYVIGSYSVKDWDISSTNSVIGVICDDMSRIFKSINVPSIPLLTRTVDDMLSMAFDQLKGVNWEYIDKDTQIYCQHITTPDNWFYSSDLLSLLNKICTLGFLRIYWYIDKFIVARCY